MNGKMLKRHAHNNVTSPLTPHLKNALKLHEAGNLQAARSGYQSTLRQYPQHSIALLYYGVWWYDHCDYDRAETYIRLALKSDPEFPPAHNHLALTLLALDRLDESIDAFKKAVRLKPDYYDALNNLATALKQAKRYKDSEAVFSRLLSREPNNPQINHNYGLLLRALRRTDEAGDHFQRALAASPHAFKAAHQLGAIAEERGDFNMAASYYKKASEIAPNYASPIISLLGLRSFEPNELMLKRAEQLANSKALRPPDSFTICFSLARRYDHAGATSKAFQYLNMANERRGELCQYDPHTVERQFSSYRSVFTRDFVERHLQDGSFTERPVFVVGMPRTGTTLTEQILACHPEVFGAGELPTMAKLTWFAGAWLRESGRSADRYPQCLQALDSTLQSKMTARYIGVLQKLASAERRVIDKNPFNFLNLGLIALLFPEARIIHCHRHPLDIGLSCFFELFELKQDFTTDLLNFAHYYNEYVKMMDYWRATLPLQIHNLPYERLVTDTESTTRDVLEFCGLEWHPSCLEPHKREAVVLTPSKWQVRQPVYRSAVYKWKRYESELRPLQDRLMELGVELPDNGALDIANHSIQNYSARQH